VAIVDLVCGDRLSPEERESNVREDPLLRRARGPVFALHHAVVGRGSAKRDSIPLIVRANACKRARPGDAALEMIDVRRFKTGHARLIVAAVLVKPGNRVGIGPAIRRHRGLILRRDPRSQAREREQRQRTRFQDFPAIRQSKRFWK